ncbi:MAG: GNAT family N-acetyltransferase [Erysipelotrichaceae bacterium]|nr:GNAT family N-acetyltransferase [Erysipelotrichaceae bacterium]
MNISSLSNKYNVRKLDREDIPSILSLCKENKIYYDYCPPMVNEESIVEDMIALPTNKTIDDKYYVGFFDKHKLIAILDLIVKYPNDETCFIGFFMMDINKQNNGIGSDIIKDICNYLKSLNYKKIRLAWIEGNKQAEHFWYKNGFKDLCNKKDQNNNNVIEAQKEV